MRLPRAAANPPKFDAQRAFAYLEKQCEFGPRPPGTAAHRKTQAYLFAELQNIQIPWCCSRTNLRQPLKHCILTIFWRNSGK